MISSPEFYFYSPILMPPIDFSSLTAEVNASYTMLNSSRNGGHPCLVKDLSGNDSSIPPLNKILALGLKYIHF